MLISTEKNMRATGCNYFFCINHVVVYTTYTHNHIILTCICYLSWISWASFHLRDIPHYLLRVETCNHFWIRLMFFLLFKSSYQWIMLLNCEPPTFFIFVKLYISVHQMFSVLGIVVMFKKQFCRTVSIGKNILVNDLV